MCGFHIPSRRNRKTFITAVEKSQYVTTKDIADVFHSGDTSTIGLHRPVGDVETGVYNRNLVFFRCMLKEEFANYIRI